MTYRVIQWATGECGRMAVKAIAHNPELELVAARVFNPDKVGRDVGDICGIAPLGVYATDNEEVLLALDADCVLWMAEASMFALDAEINDGLDELCRILRSGKNVISIVHTHLIHPESLPSSLRDPLEAACRDGNVSFLATGIDPGFNLEVLGLAASGLCRRIERLKAMEILNYGPHNNRQIIFDVMGFGLRPRDEIQKRFVAMIMHAYAPSLHLAADGLNVKIEKIKPYITTRVAARNFEVASGTIKKGTVSAMQFGFSAYVDGRPRIIIEHTTRMASEEAPDWPQGHGYYVDIDGDPPVHLELLLGQGGDRDPLYYPNAQHVAVPMRAVNSIPALCRAAPGLCTMLDLPMIAGRGALAQRP